MDNEMPGIQPRPQDAGRYKVLVETLGDAVYVVDISTGRILDCNQQACLDLGYPREELLKLTTAEIEAEISRENVEAVHTGLKPGAAVTVRGTHRRKDGSSFPVEIRLCLFESAGPKQLVSIARDITERVRAEEALKENEEKYRTLIEHASDGIIIIQDGILRFANTRMARLDGSAVEKLVGTPFTDHVHPDELPRIREMYRRRMAGEPVPSVYETVLRRNDGSDAPAELNSTVITYQGKPASLVIVRDISDRRKAEELSRQAWERYRTLVENINLGVTLLAADRTILATNSWHARMYDKSPGELVGKKCFQLFEKREAICPHCPGTRALAEGRYTETESRGLRDDGGEIRVRVQAFPVKDADGKVRSYIEVVEDIGERKKAEESLRKSEDRFRMISENSMTGIYIMQDGVLKYVNPYLVRISGYAQEEMIGRNPLEFVHPDDRTIVEEYLRKRAAGSKETVRYEIRMIGKSGEILTFELLGGIIDFDGRPAIMGNLLEIGSRKRAEEALRKSEDRFRTISESSLGGIYIIQDDVFKYVNPVLAQMLGYSVGELTGKKYLDCIHPDDRGRAEERVRRRIEGLMETVRYEMRMVRKDGNVLVFDLFGSRIEFDGRPAAMGNLVDITDRKKAEEALEQRNSSLAFMNALAVEMASLPPDVPLEEVLTKMLRNVNGVAAATFSDFDPVDRALVPNCIEAEPGLFNKLVHLLGKKPSDVRCVVGDDAYHEMVGSMIRRMGTVTECSFGAVPPLVGAAIQKLLGSDRCIGIAYVIGGELFGASVLIMKEGMPDPPAELLRSFAHMAAVSLRRRRAEEALQRSTHFLATTINSLGEWIHVVDADLRVVLANSSFETMVRSLGFTGKIIGSMVGTECPCFSPKAEDEYRSVFEKGVVLRTEETFDLGGRAYTVETVKTPVFEGDRVVRVITMTRDMSERKRLEDNLVQTQKMAAIGQLAGGIAHDFNNLLNVILGFSEITLKELDPQSQQANDIEVIRKAAKRAALLTSQLLAFSRKQTSLPAAFSLNDVVTDIEQILRRLIGEDIVLQFDLDPGLKNIFADRTHQEQVVLNLAVNARDAMPLGGKLTIATSNVTLSGPDCAAMPEARPGEFVRLSVRDTGAGMSEETLRHLFEPFFTTKGVGKGTGLGLSVIYGIIKQLDGWIQVISAQGLGTEFRIYIPVCRPETKEPETPGRGIPGGAGAGARILLVEDEEAILNMARRLLSENKYQVFTAANAGEALAVFEREKGDFHLLFSDSVMPGKRGVDLAGEILSRNPRIKVLITSGYIDDRSQLSEIKERGYHFLPKPYEIDDLLAEVRKILETY